MKIRNIIQYTIVFITITFFTGCNTENDIIHVTMKDRTEIAVKDKTIVYDTEESFNHSVTLLFHYNHYAPQIEKVEYATDSLYSISGYDQVFSGGWELVKFGSWITKYGLTAEKEYFVATDVLTKYISPIPDDLMLEPCPSMENMGFLPGFSQPYFIAYNNNNIGACVMQTCDKKIKYDSTGNYINLNINNLETKLTWNFLITKNMWE